MSSLKRSDNANRYWQSLGELADTAEFRRFLEAEFPAAESGGIDRRRWLQVMGASLALAGVGGCRWEKEEILPFDKRPADRTPGQPQRFATAMQSGSGAIGLLVTSVDGRPVKIEGNPDHPASRGATDAIAQAALLELYDPDRSQNVYRKNGRQILVQTWDDLAAFVGPHFGRIRRNRGACLRVLSPAVGSPTLAAQRDALLEAFPDARWCEYDPISRANEPAGAQLALGKPLRTQIALDNARVIVCLDADLFGDHPESVRLAAEFAAGREPAAGGMSRLYVVESAYSITGATADDRLPMPSSKIAAFASQLIDAVLLEKPPEPGENAEFVAAVAKDLLNNRSLVVAGRQQPPAVHAAVHLINLALGNVGRTVALTAEPQASSSTESIGKLVSDMQAGDVNTLLILGGNPVYDAPADLGFAGALGKVATTIHSSLYRDETSLQCTWHVPQAHFLESWGDARSYDGTYSIVQPMIEPLYGSRSIIELMAGVVGGSEGDSPIFAARKSGQSPGRSVGLDLVRRTFRNITGEEDFERRWRRTLHDGLLSESKWPAIDPPQQPAISPEQLKAKLQGLHQQASGLELVFRPDARVGDGRRANNGWLQELPDPMTRLTWGNAALIGPATAKQLGIEDQTIVRLKYGDAEPLEIPAYVMPGQATGSVAVALGYGRTAAGHVGGLADESIEPVGTNVYKLRTSKALEFATGLIVEPTGQKHELAGVQDHFAIDAVGSKARENRAGVLIREATLEHYREHPDFAAHAVHHPPLRSLWEEHRFEGYHWGMTIDLSKCTGCGACVVACQAENNIPVVGPERISEGREMHWLRVDRFFQGDPERPRSVLRQPVPCQHCELAPCEQVCPVNATVHDREGLNVMVYNRCVGTRYCANNCPYKVRRFNYFNYHKALKDPDNETIKMVYNPEVTVRSRGVMEKCTYCTQRIQAAKILAKRQRRTIRDGEIKTACQQVCPTGAIVFGDLSDQRTEVARAAAGNRNYAMLAELNVKPRTTYLARIRNPNPELENEEG